MIDCAGQKTEGEKIPVYAYPYDPENVFTYHSPKQGQVVHYQNIREKAKG